MDYVIAGLGSGAVITIVGFLLRELGLTTRTSFPRWMAPGGVALMFAALIIWMVTGAAFFSGMDDDSALPVVAGSAVVATLGSLFAAAVMDRTHRPGQVLATAAVAAQGEDAPAATFAVETVDSESLAEASKDAEPAEADPPSDDDDAGDLAGPEPEKNWAEIWRQTWGSDSMPELTAETGEESGARAAPVEAAVLESWGVPANSEGELKPGQQVEISADSDVDPGSAPSSDVAPVEVAAEDSGAENESKPATPETDDIDAEPGESETLKVESDEESGGEGALNGNVPATEVDLANSRSRDQV